MKPRNETNGETVATLSELANRLGVKPQNLTAPSKRPEWRKLVCRPGGRYDVAAALEYRQQALLTDKAKIGGELKDLKAKRLQQQIDQGAVLLGQMRRDDELHRIEYEAKRGEWASREQVGQLCGRFAAAMDAGVDAVGAITRSADAVDAVREKFAGLRRDVAKWMEGQKK